MCVVVCSVCGERGRSVRGLAGEPRVRQLRGHLDPAVEEGRHRTLPVQRVRALPPHERHEQAGGQEPEETGERHSSAFLIYI